MPLRFAIIKVLGTKVGNFTEDVVYEHDEERVYSDIVENLKAELNLSKHNPRWGAKRWTEEEIDQAFKKAWDKTITSFKRVTISIL